MAESVVEFKIGKKYKEVISMDSQKTIRKYIGRSPVGSILGWIALALAVVCVIMGITASGNTGDAVAEPFYPSESDTGSYAYVDVVGISDWLYQYDNSTYYTIIDAEGYMYTAKVSDSQFRKMDAQLNYFMDETAPMPEPCRLEGIVRSTSSSLRSTLADVWEITTEEYEYYFGNLMLDTTSSPSSEAGAGWFVGAMFAFIFGLCMVLVFLPIGITTKKSLNRLEELNLTDRAAQQLESGSYTTVGKNQIRLSENVLFAKGTGVAVPYSDILWIYKRTVRTNLVIVNLYLVVATKDKEHTIHLGGTKAEPLLQQAAVAIAEKNPNVLIGYSAENKKAYKALKKS